MKKMFSEEVSDAALASASAKYGMGGGAMTSIFGCLSQNDLLVLLGVITTAGGFIVNLIFQWRKDKRAKEEHEMNMKLMEAQLHAKQDTSH